MSNQSARIFYLQTQHKLSIPTSIAAAMNNGDVIQKAGALGLEGVIVDRNLDPKKTREFWQRGASSGYGTEDELKALVADEVYSRLIAQDKSSLDVAKVMSDIWSWQQVRGNGSSVDTIETSFADSVDDDGIDYFKTGVVPFDDMFGGTVSQGIHILAAKPGSGKTTLLLALAENMRRQLGNSGSIWYYNLELPSRMIQSIISRGPQKRTKFLNQDRIYTGQYTIEQVVERVKDNPDPDRVLIYDGPDVAAFWVAKERRFAIEHIYMHLLSIKEHCKLIIVSSQVPRHGETMVLGALAESSFKANTADRVGIFEVEERYPLEGTSNVRMKSVKNRYGPTDIEIGATFDYRNVVVTPHDLDDLSGVEGLA
jgi:Mrp family chromosome partitioning ATPase